MLSSCNNCGKEVSNKIYITPTNKTICNKCFKQLKKEIKKEYSAIIKGLPSIYIYNVQ